MQAIVNYTPGATMTRIDYARYSENVAMFVRENCRRRRMLQKTWPDLFGFTKQAVNSWRAGKAYPSFENLLAIADHFKEDIDVIVGWRSRHRS